MNAAMTTLVDFLLDELRALHLAEIRSCLVLPALARRAVEPGLRAALEQQAKATEEQIHRLQRIFTMLGQEAPRGEAISDCAGEKEPQAAATDAAIIGMAQQARHYEIASYGYLYTYAQFLGLREIGELLALSLEEETEGAQTFAEIADREGYTAATTKAAA